MRKILILLLLPFALHALGLRDDGGHLTPPAKKFLELCEVPSDLNDEEILPFLQTHWLQHNRERWEMEENLEDKRVAAFPLLRDLGCIDTIHAEKNFYDYALVLGATGKTMQRRLDFLYEEWERGVRFGMIVLLTGERDLDPEIEIYPEGLKTETDLFVHLFINHPLFGIAPYVVIDSPKEMGRRPNTASTIRDFLSISPIPGSCLAISTQPFVGYQEAVIKLFLPHSFSIETIGPRLENPYPMAIYLDNFAKWLLYEEMRALK